MVVAMSVARVMKMPVDHIVDVITVPDGCVGAAWPVLVVHRVYAASVRRRAARGILLVDVECVLFDRVAFDMLEVPFFVKVVAMVTVLDHGMAAVRPVRMDMGV
jgi:hypothetical protein